MPIADDHRKERTLKRFINAGVSIIVAVLIEVMVFHYSEIKMQLLGAETVILSANDLLYADWDILPDGKKVSQLDPILYVEGLSIQLETLTIQLEADSLPESYTIFYMTEPGDVPSVDKMVTISPVTGKDTVAIHQNVSAIRIDPGEVAGLVLNDVSLVLNEANWDISIARIVAMLVVFWGAAGLMTLQKSPDYGLNRGEDLSTETKEE